MFEFALEPEEALAQETASIFAHEVLRPASRAHEANGVPVEVFRQYHTLGFAMIDFPAQWQGLGQGLFAKVLTLEELAWGDAGATLALENVSWLGPVFALMPRQDAEATLAEFSRQPMARVAFADGRDLALEVHDELISGELPFVPSVQPRWLLLRTRSTLVLLPAENFHVAPVDSAGVEAAGGSRLWFEGARPSWMISEGPEVERIWSRTRLALAAMFVGVARAALEYAVEYACARNVFGRPIAQHQGPAFLLADMRTSIEAARMALWYAAKAYDHRTNDAPLWAAHAFLEAADCTLCCTRDAVQLLGGHGFLRDHPVEKWMRDARVLTLLCGGRDLACEDLLRWKERNLQSPSGSVNVDKKGREQ